MLRFVVLCTLVVSALSASLSPVIDPEWEGFIVGGSTASAGQFPHQVSLRSSANAHFCGGFVINNRWVGSAAHCTIGRTNANTISVVGTNSRTSGGVSHATARIVNHPSYNANTLANDISMVQTASTITFTNLVQPITLGSVFVGGGVSATVSGWGQTSHPGSAAANLMFLTAPTLTNADCRSRHSTANAARVFDNTICTFLRSGTGTCMGDSGGPLISGGTVIGAVSWGIACAQGFPDVFARISSHRTWMISQM
ncbi:chymotrypsin-2-like [Chironomus tepperi]|uniref:chymotrypsin-2-like n=1 Tax=Chironomus tepperi TaxID=113505 RepID=UPI00391F64CD